MRHYVLFPALVGLSALWVLAVRRFVRNERTAAVVQFLPLPFMVAYMWRASQPARFLNDFKKAYYPAGVLIRHGHADRLYDQFPPTFTNIPIVAWAFAPLTSLNVDDAGKVFTALGIGAVVAAVVLLTRFARLRNWRLVVFVGIVAINGPLYNSLREGNTTHFVWLALIGAMMFAESRRDLLAGVLIGASAVLKPPFGLLLLPYLARQRWQVVAGTLATGGALLIGCVVFYGIDLHRDWYEVCVEPFSREPLGASNVQSLDAVLARLITGDEYITDFRPITEFGSAFWAMRTGLALLIVSGAVIVCWKWRSAEPHILLRQELCIALCLALMLAPTSWVHYYLVLLIPIALALGERLGLPANRTWWILLGIVVALISPPVVALDTENELVRSFMGHFGFSHYFVGGALLLAMMLAARIRGTLSRESTGPPPIPMALSPDPA